MWTQRAPRKAAAGEWRPRFLAALRASANVSQASAAAGISRKTAYQHRERSEEFRAEWADAIEEACDTLEGEARRRAVEGTERPVFYRGKVVDHVREYSDILLIFLLKAHRPEKYRETVRHEIEYVRREAERLAEKYGLNAADIIAEAQAILKERP